MTRKEMLRMLERICQEARNRMRDWGVPQAQFYVEDCPRSDGLHIEIRKDSVVLASLHIWSPDSPELAPSVYEHFVFSICMGILAAEDFVRYMQEVEQETVQKFGAPPEHGGYLN